MHPFHKSKPSRKRFLSWHWLLFPPLCYIEAVAGIKRFPYPRASLSTDSWENLAIAKSVGQCGTLWDNMGQFGTMGDSVGQCGAVWDNGGTGGA